MKAGRIDGSGQDCEAMNAVGTCAEIPRSRTSTLRSDVEVGGILWLYHKYANIHCTPTNQLLSRQFPLKQSRIWNVARRIHNDEYQCLAGLVSWICLDIYMNLLDDRPPLPGATDPLQLDEDPRSLTAQIDEFVRTR